MPASAGSAAAIAGHTAGVTSSGSSTALTRARRAASASARTSNPAVRARASLPPPGRAPTTTATPESRRLRACASPWLPKPRTATVAPPSGSLLCGSLTRASRGRAPRRPAPDRDRRGRPSSPLAAGFFFSPARRGPGGGGAPPPLLPGPPPPLVEEPLLFPLNPQYALLLFSP